MSDNAYSSLKIENIVASGVIADEIDLAEISSKIEGCELNTKRFPGAVYRIDEPRMASLIFSSGKVVLTGIRNEESLDEGLNKVLSSLKEAGVKILPVPKVAVTNIVCSYDIGRFINLNRVVAKLSLEAIEYEPEQFPGLVYRIKDPKIVALLFSSGKIILTGGKNLTDVKKGLDVLEASIKDVLAEQK
ncbi:MAG: TATA-box-binding protein [Methanocorpusculum sp.]|nr:TATA-box-binding protein [Methanocorpusculum parvum]MBQ2771982.1 TATA-box-binding protein [Methanocorpusculum sp.]MBQ4134870.1 TATA-box-binding protein [Methanocorpusculum sp.]MBR4117628.1 TATA-box-binding protein [Methanocorpusculum sp.]HJJ64324.1 TATA-box-binding protein [Methanocorpusculum sp.]